VLAPPYDVVSPEEQETLHEQDEHNVIRLELARGAEDGSRESRYQHAAETLRQWRRSNVLGHDARPAFYPYEERFAAPDGELTRRGFFAAIRLHPWSDDVVLPHERTRPKPKADRMELLRACRVQFSPIFCLFEDHDGQVRELLDEAMRDTPFVCGTVTSPAAGEIARNHTLWRAANRCAQRLTDTFVNRRLYIADGHHRYETALEYRDGRRAADERWDAGAPYECVMSLLVPMEDPGLLVLPTHRLIETPRALPLDALIATWRRYFEVAPFPLPERSPGAALAAEVERRGRTRKVFGVLGPGLGQAHLLTLRAPPVDWPHPATWRDLDVGLLQGLIVEPLEAAVPGTSVEFTRDPDASAAHAAADPRHLSIVLNATTIPQIVAVARAGDKMPEKSTYFMPKVATGLVMYPLV
jgi:uncharacterized protein (DUF1015 family)